MGKQIIFFAAPVDLKLLLKEFFLGGGFVLDQCGIPISEDRIFDICLDCFNGRTFGCNLYLTLTGMNVSYFENKKGRFIDPKTSEVITFNPCTQQPKVILDTSSVDAHFKVGDYVVINDTEKFMQLMDDFMKHPCYKENPNYVENGYEHARLWFEPTYFDETGHKIAKSKQIGSLFALLQKYIKANYRLSSDGFGYIGNDAYASYLLGNFIPSSGRTPIDFN